MSALVTRLPAAAAWLAATLTLALPAIRSDAAFNSRSTNTASRVAADTPANYLRLFSQATDPAGLTGYAVKRGSSPAVPAATGADLGLTVALGSVKNLSGLAIARVFTLQAVSPLAAGASPLTVTASLAPDPLTGRQPLSFVSFSNLDGTGAGVTTTLTAGVKKQVNMTVLTRGFAGNNRLYTATLTLRITHPGYTGTFLSYQVPVTAWDGNGAGP